MKNVVFAIGVLFFSGLIAANPSSYVVDKIVVFGDSLSDTGNFYDLTNHQVPHSPPYYQGRFTNGPVWIEHLMESYFPQTAMAHIRNYAYGGGGTGPNALVALDYEIERYLSTHENKADEHSLFIVWIGANDYLGLPKDADKAVMEVNAEIASELQRLVDAGAKYFMVLNLPDLGKIPMAKDYDQQEAMSYLSQRHNEILLKTVTQFQTTYPEVQWLYFDVGHMLDEVFESPERFGFKNINETCYLNGEEIFERHYSPQPVLWIAAHAKLAHPTDLCEGYLFFDPVHPTVLAHKIIAMNIRNELDQAGFSFHEF